MGDRLRKRWRAWLRAVHRDVGYLAIGFTVIYAVSGIAQNHIEDWGEVSFTPIERTLTIEALPAEMSDAAVIARVAQVVALGTPRSALRAGDEIRLDYADGSKVTAIGTSAPSRGTVAQPAAATSTQITIQTRERRAFIGVANWLHTARGKKAWKYISDAYALFLLYLAISGIFMIKGRLGLAWRGTILISAGIAVPVLYVALSGGPASQKPPKDSATLASSAALSTTAPALSPPSTPAPTPPSTPAPTPPSTPAPTPPSTPAPTQPPIPAPTQPGATAEAQPSAPASGSAVLTPLPPDDP